MNFKIEVTDEKQKALIIAQEKHSFVRKIEKKLTNHSVEVFYSSYFPEKLHSFDYLFIFQPKKDWLVKIKNYKKKIVLIFLNDKALFDKKKFPNFKNLKIIKTNASYLNEDQIDKILWFVFSKTQETTLNLYSFNKEKKNSKTNFSKLLVKTFLSKKFIIKIVIFLFFLSHIFFIFPLIISSLYSYQLYNKVKNEDFNNIDHYLKNQKIFLDLAKRSYLLIRPTYLFFSIDNLPTNIININEKGQQLIYKTIALQQNLKNIYTLVFKKNKNLGEKELLIQEIKKIEKDINLIEDDLILINNKLPQNIYLLKDIKNKILFYLEFISQTKKIIPFTEKLLAKNNEKNYLILFANNRELRPGGGFIGSFGILKIKDLTIEKFKIYDVYDADGQLKIHIEPPEPIKKYLNQPHWFLRDSAFSPDFLENYTQAKIFLKREMNFDNFNGAILITTSAIENILEAFGNLYLPDYQENINKENFYIKTQYYTEKEFFPGSIQKKSFLSSLTNQILINFESTSFKKLGLALKKSLDEKQIVLYFDNFSDLQKIIDNLFWSGRVIKPECFNQLNNCIVDFLMPIDANLGVNKANFYVSHFLNLKTRFDDQGQIKHLLSITFKNESPSNIFPGGSYKNYFQLLLPKETIIKQITKDGTLIEKEDINTEIINNDFQKIGFLINVPIKSTVEIKIDYLLKKRFKNGNNIYQLIVQKQIGSNNIDFTMETYLARNFYILGQNYIPLVKDNQIIYNTNLSADKIFIIELIKQ